MSTLVGFLAVAGIAAAAWHFLRAAFGFLRHGVTGIWTEEMARNHVRRGDLTAYQEQERERGLVLRARRRSAWLAVGWLALLIVPSFTSGAQPIYAAYAALWVLPLVRRAGRPGQ